MQKCHTPVRSTGRKVEMNQYQGRQITTGGDVLEGQVGALARPGAGGAVVKACKLHVRLEEGGVRPGPVLGKAAQQPEGLANILVLKVGSRPTSSQIMRT